MFKEYFDINISENIETIIVYLYESGEQQKNSDLSLKWPKIYRLYHKRLSVEGFYITEDTTIPPVVSDKLWNNDLMIILLLDLVCI